MDKFLTVNKSNSIIIQNKYLSFQVSDWTGATYQDRRYASEYSN